MINDVDRKILSILQENGRTSNAEIARCVGMAPSAILERIRKLEESGLIMGYTVRLNPSKLNQGLLAFILVRTEERIWQSETGRALMQIPEVQEVHHVAGEDCFLVKLRAKNTEALGRLLQERFGEIKTIRSTQTTIVLNTEKETAALVLDRREEPPNHE